jgi:hypothetical protein
MLMPPAEILRLLRRQPFVPFRIHVDDGVTFEVRHPEQVHVNVSAAYVFFPDPNNPGMVSSYEVVALRHISRLEPMETVQAGEE